MQIRIKIKFEIKIKNYPFFLLKIFLLNNFIVFSSCWVQLNTSLAYGQFIPNVILMIVTFTLIEAAGAATYKPLKGKVKLMLYFFSYKL